MSHIGIAKPGPDGQYPTEPKVKAATGSSYLIALLLTGLMTIVQDERVPLLIGFLPEFVEPFVLALLPAFGAFIAGYYAEHQHRRVAASDQF